MTESPRVRVSVLGPARITVEGKPAPAELAWRKHLALLVYLARSPRRARTREHLIGLLWSERDDKSARHSLSEALRVFRRVLGDAHVRAEVDQVALGSDAITLDCDELAAMSASQDWAGAAALAQGDFLEGLSVPNANELKPGWPPSGWGRARSMDVLTRHARRRSPPARSRGGPPRYARRDSTDRRARGRGGPGARATGDRTAAELARRLGADLSDSGRSRLRNAATQSAFGRPGSGGVSWRRPRARGPGPRSWDDVSRWPV
jgi:hypothetical protein